MSRVRRNRRSTTRTTRSTVKTVVQAPSLRNKSIQSRLDHILHPKLSLAGTNFLKCAFASPDFGVDPGQGIPDKYSGKTIGIKDCFTSAINFPAGQDTFICIAPVPGYAYFMQSVATGALPTNLVGVRFPSYQTNFGTAVASANPVEMNISNFQRFRYASLAAGVYPTSNLMQFAGSISVWKGDINLNVTSGSVLIPPTLTPGTQTGAAFNMLQGGECVSSLVPRDNYTESFIKGAYSMALDRTGEFDWTNFWWDTAYNDYFAPNQLSFTQADTASPLPGWGNMETIIIKVSAPTGAVDSANLKIWNCLEMQVNTSSNLYQFAGTSPPLDELALETYSRIRNELPVAVPCADNAGFWRRVLGIIRGVAGFASVIPGPIGLIGQGVSGLYNM